MQQVTPQNIISITYQLVNNNSHRYDAPFLTIQFVDGTARQQDVSFQELLPYLKYLKVKADSLAKSVLAIVNYPYNVIIYYGDAIPNGEAGNIMTLTRDNGTADVVFTAASQVFEFFQNTLTFYNGSVIGIGTFKLPRTELDFLADWQLPAGALLLSANSVDAGLNWEVTCLFYAVAPTNFDFVRVEAIVIG